MASAVVGALRVLLEVNASQLEGEFGKATISVGNFDKFTQNAGRNLQRMVESFSGQKIVAEATTMAAAIEKIGGIAGLTERELKRVAGTVNEATAKMRAMGVEIPPSLAKVKGEIDALGMGAQKAGGFFGVLGKAGAALGPLLPVSSVVGLTTALVSMGSKALASASDVADLSERTGHSTEAIQRMQHVANQTGSSVETFTSAAFRLGVTISQGTTKARDAVNELGLSYEQLKRQKPEDQFAAVVRALENVESVQERNRLGVALFGKQFAEMAGAVKQGYTDIANAASVVEDAQIQALDAAGDAWTKFVDDVGKEVQRFLGEVILAAQGIENLKPPAWMTGDLAGPGRFGNLLMLSPEEQRQQADWLAQGKSLESFIAQLEGARKAQNDYALSSGAAGAATRDFTGEIEDAKDRIKNLSKSELKELNAALKVGGEAAEDYAASLGLNELALKLYKEQQQAAKRATDDTAKAQRSIFGVLTDQTRLLIDYNVGWTDYELNQIRAAGATDDLTAMVLAQAIGLKDTSQTINFGVIPSLQTWISAEVGLKGAIEQTLPKVEDQTQKQKRLLEASNETSTSLRNLAQGFANLAQIAGENGLGKTLQTIGQIVAGMALVRDGVDAVSKGFNQIKGGNLGAGFSQMASGILSVAAAMEQATRSTNKWQAALGGFVTGAQAGGVWGGIFGAIIGYIRAADNARDAAIAAAREFRKSVQALRGELNALLSEANFLNLSQQIEDLLDNARTEDDLERIRELLQQVRNQTSALNDEMADLFDLMENSGFSIPPEMELFFNSFMDILDPANKAKLQSLLGVLGEQEVPWEKMQQAAEKFGIDIGSLGQKFQGAKLKASATEIINAFEMLTKNGADVGGVLFGMRDEISALVQDAKKFGTEIPAQMKPWIEELLRSGHLVDENGDALQDLGGIRFGPPIESQFDKILKKIEELIDRFIHLADVIGKVPKLPSDIIPDKPFRGDEGDDRFKGFANGGLVTRPTLALLGERGPELVTPLRRHANPRAVPIPNIHDIVSPIFGRTPSDFAGGDRPSVKDDFRSALREMREDLKSWLESFGDSMAVTMRDAAMGAY